MLDTPQLVERVRAMPPQAFAAMVRQIGVEDSGELVALATHEQLLTAFDEELFVNAAPGERESFDGERFATWLEVLLEGGDAAAAARLSAMSEDFVVHALSSLVIVLEPEVLQEWISDSDAAVAIDKRLEGAPCEEIDGYLLVSRDQLGWDAVLSVVLALDRDRRDYLVRVLDRCVEVTGRQLEQEGGLLALLDGREQLAEDVEAEREERRAEQGYVEPRQARAFLVLASQSLPGSAASWPRDALTNAYFRELPQRMDEPASAGSSSLASDQLAVPGADTQHELPLVEAMRVLADNDPLAFGARRDELAYVTNVLLAGAEGPNGRFTPVTALETALTTVALGATLESGQAQELSKNRLEASAPGGLTRGILLYFAGSGRGRKPLRGDFATALHPSAAQLAEVLRACSADRLFRRASAASPAPHLLAR